MKKAVGPEGLLGEIFGLAEAVRICVHKGKNKITQTGILLWAQFFSFRFPPLFHLLYLWLRKVRDVHMYECIQELSFIHMPSFLHRRPSRLESTRSYTTTNIKMARKTGHFLCVTKGNNWANAK